MERNVSLEEFYSHHLELDNLVRTFTKKELGHFNVFSRKQFCNRPVAYSRRDFYKITLLIGTGKIHFARKTFEINQNALMFSDPQIPYCWEPVSEKQDGYFCIFTEEFISEKKILNYKELPMYRQDGTPVYFLDEPLTRQLSDIFGKMLEEARRDYLYRHDLLRTYMDLIIHTALKLSPAEAFTRPVNASSRITSLFMELLERQFPVDSPGHILKLKTPGDYAGRLLIHVNHLNRAVKKTTGKTTSELIALRIAAEAKKLLIHTDWNISEIAYCLGFDYPSYFDNFFRKQTNVTPRSLRD